MLGELNRHYPAIQVWATVGLNYKSRDLFITPGVAAPLAPEQEELPEEQQPEKSRAAAKADSVMKMMD